MTRLQSELHRLYGVHAPDGTHITDDDQTPIRAMVLSLGRPADWPLLSGIWQGVQADLRLPAPAIAVSGTDAYELWFSLAEPVPWAQARAFLEALRKRHLSDALPGRTSLMPAGHADERWPPRQMREDQWSAFVAPDLAPVFAETPWLDIPPNLDGQADLLSRLASIQPDEFERAMRQLAPPRAGAAAAPLVPVEDSVSSADEGAPGLHTAHALVQGRYLDPKVFLLDVMNDKSVALALRIEAAKALLLGNEVSRPKASE